MTQPAPSASGPHKTHAEGAQDGRRASRKGLKLDLRVARKWLTHYAVLRAEYGFLDEQMLGLGFFRHSSRRQAGVALHDAFVIVMAMPLALMLRDNRLIDGERHFNFFSGLPLLFICTLVAMSLLGSHRAVWRYTTICEIRRLARFTLLAILLFYVGQFLIDRLAHLPRSLPPIHFLVAMFLLIGSRIAYGEYCRWKECSSKAPHPRVPLLLVGSGDGAALFIQLLASRGNRRYEIVGILCDALSRHRSVSGIPVLGGLADVDAVLANLRVQGMSPSRLVITRPHHELGREAVYRLMQRADLHRISVEHLPDLMRFEDEATAESALSIELAANVYPRLKRVFDICVSVLVLVATAPILGLTAVAVAVAIQRPVMFVQLRPGLHRHPFRLVKLRTMTDPIGPDGGQVDDAERTPFVGRLLRRTRLDELPQFWNVLIGDMAIIGPRPLLAADLDALPDQGGARCRTRPGITGWAQVNGGHSLAPEEKHALDLWYIRNASFRVDAIIVWRTLWMMLTGERRDPAAIAMARSAQAPAVVVAAE